MSSYVLNFRWMAGFFTIAALAFGTAAPSWAKQSSGLEKSAREKNSSAKQVERASKPSTKKTSKAKNKRAKPIPSIGTPPVKLSMVKDAELAAVYAAISQGQSSKALTDIEALLLKAPNYKLLHLLRADLLLMRSNRAAVKTTNGLSPALPALTAEQQQRVKQLQQEAWLRLNSKANLAKASNNNAVPRHLLKLADNEPFALVVDSKLSRLYVYKNMPNATPVLVSDHYVTQGAQGVFKLKEGDNRTPIGAYFSSGPIQQSLPDLYGYGALNMDYPNVWDKSKGRTGYGIWVHGTPSDTYARAPYASNGCVVLANPDMEQVFKLSNQGAMPVVVLDQMEWVDAGQLLSHKKQLLDTLEQWRVHSEQRDLVALARLYSNSFKMDDADKTKWLQRKQEASPNARAKITLSNVALIEYPGEPDLFLARFDVLKESNSSDKTAPIRKQMYLKKEWGSWKIVLEPTV
jgi:murein L,D-transpeptidase YafK